MNTRLFFKLLVFCTLCSIVLTACAPAAAPTQSEVISQAPAEAQAAPAQQPAYIPMALPTLAAPNASPVIDTFFENYGVNPFVDSEDDELSTFALDVDTGSYTVAQAYIHDGNLPDKDGVRVEEFVNYFRQGYDLPSERERFAIQLDGGPAPFTQNERYSILRVGIQGYAVDSEERPDASLIFVIDVSGSMDMDNRLGLVKRSLEVLVEQLGRRDTVGIVVYGTEARTILEPTSAADKDEIMDAIERLQPEGSTNAEAGIRKAYKLAERYFNSEGINRVILCSDGVANVGQTGAGDIWSEVEDYAERGITLTTVGFGMDNYNDVLMEQLADMGDGFYTYVDNIKEAERIFVTNLTSNLQVIGKDAKVQVEFDPEVVARYRLIGYENRAIADEDFRNDEVDAGEVGAGHSVTALYEIKLQPDAHGTVATVNLRWLDPEDGDPSEISAEIETRDFEEDFEETDPRFQWDVVVAEYAEVLRQSYWAEETNLEDVLAEAERINDLLDHDPDVKECVKMIKKTVELY